MRTLLFVTLASVAAATGAYAQSSHTSRGIHARAQAVPLAVPAVQAPNDISRLCGVDYAITDPDPNIRFELRRNCIAGVNGGGD
jgi:hypothetical protein